MLLLNFANDMTGLLTRLRMSKPLSPSEKETLNDTLSHDFASDCLSLSDLIDKIAQLNGKQGIQSTRLSDSVESNINFLVEVHKQSAAIGEQVAAINQREL